MPRELILTFALLLAGCIRKPQQFVTPTANDRSVLFPLSVGNGLYKVEAGKATYALDGEVLRALVIAGNDYIPPGIPNPPCWARIEALKYRFTRQDDILFVYVEENPAYCGGVGRPIHSGAKYAISKDGRILRRIVDGMDADDAVWFLRAPDGGSVTVVTRPDAPTPRYEDLEKPDSGILKVVTEPVTMPGVIVVEPLSLGPVEEGPGIVPGMSFLPFDSDDGGVRGDAGLDGGSSQDGG